MCTHGTESVLDSLHHISRKGTHNYITSRVHYECILLTAIQSQKGSDCLSETYRSTSLNQFRFYSRFSVPVIGSIHVHLLVLRLEKAHRNTCSDRWHTKASACQLITFLLRLVHFLLSDSQATNLAFPSAPPPPHPPPLPPRAAVFFSLSSDTLLSASPLRSCTWE